MRARNPYVRFQLTELADVAVLASAPEYCTVQYMGKMHGAVCSL